MESSITQEVAALRRQTVAELRQRYARYYSAVANSLYYQDFQHPEPVRALVRRELPNLRHALALLLEKEQSKEASDMTNSLAHFLPSFGMLREREAMGLNEITLLPAMAEARGNLDDFAKKVIARY